MAADATYPISKMTDEQIDKTCSGVSGISRMVMKARQDGTSMNAYLTGLKKTVSSDTSYNAIKKVAIEAWSRPMMRVQKNKDTAVTEFSDKAMVGCYKQLSK